MKKKKMFWFKTDCLQLVMIIRKWLQFGFTVEEECPEKLIDGGILWFNKPHTLK